MSSLKIRGLALVGLGVLISGLTISCGGDINDTEVLEQDSIGHESAALNTTLKLTKISKELITGTLTTTAGQLKFTSKINSTVRSVVFEVGSREIGHVSLTKGTRAFSLYALATAQDRAMVVELLGKLSALKEKDLQTTYGSDISFPILSLALAASDLFSIVPVQAAAISVEKTLPASASGSQLPTMTFGDDGILYLWQCKTAAPSADKIATAEWTDSNGQNTLSGPCGSQASACQGRCGSGCTATCTGKYCAPKQYSKDCFDLDVCQANNAGDTTGSNCSGEWADSADDVVDEVPSGW